MDPHLLREIRKGWEEIKGYLLSLEDENRSMHKIPEIIELVPYFDAVLSDGILKRKAAKLEELPDHLLEIRQVIINKTNLISVNTRSSNKETINEIISLLNKLKLFFADIENIDIFVDLYRKGDEVITGAKQKYDERIAELLGEVTEKFIYSHYKIQADKIADGLLYKTIAFFVLLFFFFMFSLALFCSISIDDMTGSQIIYAVLAKILILMPMIWGLVFLSRRIFDDKKLEQTYRHKEVVSRSYLNYLEFMKYQYIDNDSVRLALSKIAVESLGLNPALLLDKSTAEKIPMEELLIKLMDKAQIK